jgi:hypothetical protein
MGNGFTQFHHEDLWIITSSKRTKRFGCDSTHNDGDLSATQIQHKKHKSTRKIMVVKNTVLQFSGE